MADFVRLTRDTKTGEDVYVNLDLVTQIFATGRGGSLLHFARGDHTVAVREDMNTIVSKIPLRDANARRSQT